MKKNLLKQAAIDKIEELQSALETEKHFDKERYKYILEQYSLAQKQEKGLALYPLECKDYGYIFGDNIYVDLKYKSSIDDLKKSEIRAGHPIRIIHSSESEHQTRGILHFIKKDQLKIILQAKEHPDWIFKGHLILESVFDETTYKAMEGAIEQAKEAEGQFAYFLNAFYDSTEISSAPNSVPFENNQLNSSQNAAVEHILSKASISILHGPPGTGKTTTLVSAIKALIKKQNKILVCAPSNAAVDVLTARLYQKGVKVVRIGNISRVDEEVVNATIDGILNNHEESKRIKDIKLDAIKIKKKALKYKRKFGFEEREERKRLLKEAKDLLQWANQLEKQFIHHTIASADVIACTLIHAEHSLLKDVDFDLVCIDEAGQCIDPALYIPLQRADKIVLAGDPFQLPPTVKSPEAQKKGLHKNVLELWIQSSKPSCLLNMQYRMNENIMSFSNSYFYNSNLKSAPEVERQLLKISENTPLEFIDIAGCGFEESMESDSTSKYNEGELGIVREHLMQLFQSFEQARIEPHSIAILSPYRAQVVRTEEMIAFDNDLNPYKEYIKVNSIDAFQGNERDIVYLSLVRSNSKGEIGFLKDYRRMNVAMTRARFKLIVIADSSTIGMDDFYNQFLQTVEKNGVYRSAWEYMGAY